MSAKCLLGATYPAWVYIFFVKSQSKRPETGAYLENTTLLIPTILGSQGLILRLTGEVIGTDFVVLFQSQSVQY